MRFLPTLAAVCLLCTTPALAENVAYLYACDVNDNSSKKRAPNETGFISDAILLSIDKNGGGKVVDHITLLFAGKSVPARVAVRGNRLSFFWKVKNVVGANGTVVPSFGYSAVLNIKTNVIRVQAKPGVDFEGTWAGKGTCSVQKDIKLPKVFG
jgi:hypothetical protein